MVDSRITQKVLYTNVKKCQFYQEEVWFLGYVMSSKGIRIEDKKINAVK